MSVSRGGGLQTNTLALKFQLLAVKYARRAVKTTLPGLKLPATRAKTEVSAGPPAVTWPAESLKQLRIKTTGGIWTKPLQVVYTRARRTHDLRHVSVAGILAVGPFTADTLR